MELITPSKISAHFFPLIHFVDHSNIISYSMSFLQLLFVAPVLVPLSLTFYQSHTTNPIGYAYYIDKPMKTIQRFGLTDPLVKVADLSEFPCEILNALSLWNCKLLVIGKQCSTSGVVQLPHFNLTLMSTSPSQKFSKVACVTTHNTIYVCGWKEKGIVDGISCTYMTKDNLTFMPMQTLFNRPRTDFFMHIIRSQLCIFGGYKENKLRGTVDRTKETECAEINATPTQLTFTSTSNANLSSFRGEASSLQMGNALMYCGGLQKSDIDPVMCEWLNFAGDPNATGLDHVTKLLNDYCLKPNMQLIQIAPVSDNTHVTVVYSFGDGKGAEVLTVPLTKSVRYVVSRRLDMRSADIVPLSISTQCVTDNVSTTSAPTVLIQTLSHISSSLSSQSASSSTVALSNSSCANSSPIQDTRLSIGLTVALCISIVIILLLTGYIYENKRAKSDKSHYHVNKAVTPSSMPQKSDGRSEGLITDSSHQNSLPKQSNTSSGVSISMGRSESSVVAGPDSSTVRSIALMFNKAADFASKPPKQRSHHETSTVETVSTSIPSGAFEMMNPRAEQTDSSSAVPLKEMPIKFVKRILRQQRQNQRQIKETV